MTDTLYHEAIKALARDDHGHGHLDAADLAIRLDNPLCGDRIELQASLTGSRIAALRQDTRGCLLCRASASLLALRAPGATFAELVAQSASLRSVLHGLDLDPAAWPDLAMFLPVRMHRSRHACVLLPFQAMEALAMPRSDPKFTGNS